LSTSGNKTPVKYVPPQRRKLEDVKIASKKTDSWEFQNPSSRASPQPTKTWGDQSDKNKGFEKDRKFTSPQEKGPWGKGDKEEQKTPQKSPFRSGTEKDNHWGRSSSRSRWSDNSSGRWGSDESNPFEEDKPSESVGTKIDFEKYDEIEVDTSGRDVPAPIESWKDVTLGETLMNNIKLAKYDRPTPVQKYAIPIVTNGRDLMGCAQTGSGKTAAFLFPIISLMDKSGPPSIAPEYYHKRLITPVALVLAPTRELACQIHEEARKFAYKTGMRSCVVYGGAPIGNQLRDLERGCDILVATPGRLSDMMERGRIALAYVKFLILDEADRMLDMGFEPQIRKIVEDEDMPPAGERQTLMFSATFPKEIQKLAASFLDDYIFLAVGKVGSTTGLVTQRFVKIEGGDSEKGEILLDLLESVQGLTIIFVETKKKADQLERFLLEQGFPATSIHGDRAQTDRTEALRSFSTGKTPFLIATNVAARGLDIDNIQHVVNFDMPTDIDDYVHRIGRTGRAGKTGIATALISDENAGVIPKLIEVLEGAQQEIPDFLMSYRSSKFHGYGGRGRGGYSPSKWGSRSPSHSNFGSKSSTSPSERGGYGGPRGGGGPSPSRGKFGGRDYRFEKNDSFGSSNGDSSTSWKKNSSTFSPSGKSEHFGSRDLNSSSGKESSSTSYWD